MCISPKYIAVKPIDLASKADLPFPLKKFRGKGFSDAYLRAYRPARFSDMYQDIVPRPLQGYSVPCGRCIECLRARQDDIATRCACEAEAKGSMHFLTLTYSDSNVPLSHFLRTYDPETGEYISRSDFEIFHANSLDTELSVSFLASQLRERFHWIKSSPSPRYIELSPDLLEGMSDLGIDEYSVDTFTPSLCRRDVRLWLKSSRVAYERSHSKPLSDFTYVCCGEYGPKSCRPHYHLIFFGAKRSEIEFFARRWSAAYGFYKLKTVKKVNDDGSSGYTICSKYVGKYLSKGNFECKSVVNCHAEKPRLQISKHLGLSALTPSLVEYYRASDLLGKIDVMSLKFEDGSNASRFDIQYLREEVMKRSKFVLPGGYSTRLPRSFSRYIWYFTDILFDNGKKKISLVRSSSLRRAFMAFAPPDAVSSFRERLLERYPGISPSEFSARVSSFASRVESSKLARASNQFEYLRSQYGKSVF